MLAGSGLQPVTGAEAVVVKLPHAAASALRRDRVAGPMLRRTLSPDESVVALGDLARLVARLAQLGLDWDGPAPPPDDA